MVSYLHSADHPAYVVDESLLEGLGLGVLAQSRTSHTHFMMTLTLNSYESNCLRDWLAQRWKAASLENTCLYVNTQSRLVIGLLQVHSQVEQAQKAFRSWLLQVQADRQAFSASRK